MGTLVLALFILACGWKVYKDWLVTRYAALSHAGHPQYFGAAIAAGYIFVLSACLHAAAGRVSPYGVAIEYVLKMLPIRVGEGDTPELVRHIAAIAIWSFILSILIPRLFNRPLQRSPELLIAVAKRIRAIDQLQALLIHCLRNELLVALSLKNGKVYVGVPEQTAMVDDVGAWISLWPMASGFRDRKGRLKLTTGYQLQYQESANGKTSRLAADDYRVTLARSEVVSAQTFDLETYANFSGREGASDAKDAAAGSQAGEPQSEAVFDAGEEQPPGTAQSLRKLHDIARYGLPAYALFLILVTITVLVLPLSFALAIGMMVVAWIVRPEALERALAAQDIPAA